MFSWMAQHKVHLLSLIFPLFFVGVSLEELVLFRPASPYLVEFAADEFYLQLWKIAKC